MKKSLLYLCAGVLALGLTACGDGGQGGGSSQGTEQTESSDSREESPESGSSENGEQDSSESPEVGGEESAPEESGDGTETEGTEASGWSEEMTGLRAAVVEAVGQQEYWPDMPMEPEMLETFYGITSDMYEDFMAESPMISANVDTLIIVKAKEDKAGAVMEALNTYRDALVADTMQYPQNLGKIQASKVEQIGEYVIFVQLGGFAIESDDEEEVLTKCQETNQLVLDTIREKVEGSAAGN